MTIQQIKDKLKSAGFGWTEKCMDINNQIYSYIHLSLNNKIVAREGLLLQEDCWQSICKRYSLEEYPHRNFGDYKESIYGVIPYR